MFKAAPILRLSATHQSDIPFLNARFFLILPTKTGFTPDASRVVGYSKFAGLSITLTPNEFFNGEILEIGEPTAPPDKQEKETGAQKAEMPEYRVINRPGLWKFDVPDMVTEPHGSNRFKGIVMHRIMCKIKHFDGVDSAIRQFAAKGAITADEAEEFAGIIKQGLRNPQAREWFDYGNRIISERPVCDGNGRIYRPDRVVVTPDGRTIVIDYKFGEKEDKRYLSQVKNYMSIIGKCGFGNTEGYVWYVPEDIIRKVI